MKEQIKTPEKELSHEKIVNLSDAEFKTLVIGMFRNSWIWWQNRGKSEGYAKWNEEICTGNQQWCETGTQIIGLDQKEEINIQLEQNKERRIQKNEEKLRNLWDNFKVFNIQIVGVPEGEEEEQEIENLFEQIMKENFPNLAKEIDFQESRKLRESQRSGSQGGIHQGTS